MWRQVKSERTSPQTPCINTEQCSCRALGSPQRQAFRGRQGCLLTASPNTALNPCPSKCHPLFQPLFYPHRRPLWPDPHQCTVHSASRKPLLKTQRHDLKDLKTYQPTELRGAEGGIQSRGKGGRSTDTHSSLPPPLRNWPDLMGRSPDSDF